MKISFPVLIFQIFSSIFTISADDKPPNAYDYNPTSVPILSMFNGYRLNEMARAAAPSNLDLKFHPMTGLTPDSQIYYYRMPMVAPYVYFSDFGGYRGSAQPFVPFPSSSLPVQLPLSFLANGKPTSIHTYSSGTLPTTSKIKPEAKPDDNQNSNMFNLNKGPYFFNGKTTDVYLLQDTFNTFNTNPLNSFYP